MKITPETPINELKAYRKELGARWGPMSEALYQSRPNQAAEVAYSDFESLVSAVDSLIATKVSVPKDAHTDPVVTQSQPVMNLEAIHGTSTHTIRELTEEEKVARRDAAQRPPADWVDNTPDGGVAASDDSDSAFNADSLIAFLDDHGRSGLAGFRADARNILGQLQGGAHASAQHNLAHLVEKVRPAVASYRDDELKDNIYHEAHRNRVKDHPVRRALIAVANKIEEAYQYLSTGRNKLAIQSLNTAKG